MESFFELTGAKQMHNLICRGLLEEFFKAHPENRRDPEAVKRTLCDYMEVRSPLFPTPSPTYPQRHRLIRSLHVSLATPVCSAGKQSATYMPG